MADEGFGQAPGGSAGPGASDLGLPKRKAGQAAGGLAPPPLDPDSQWVDPRRPTERVEPGDGDGDGASARRADRATRSYRPLTSDRIKRVVLPLPGGESPPSAFSIAWFIGAFIVPVLIGTVYYLFIASAQYTTEFRFSVRPPVMAPGMGAAQSAAAANSMASLFAASSPAEPDTLDNYTVTDYVMSEQASRDLQSNIDLSAMYSRPGIDIFSRLGSHKTPEQLAAYWKRMTYASFDPATGLAVVKVRAFTPADSYRIAMSLLDRSNEIVNQIGLGSQKDSLRIAQVELKRTETDVAQLEAQLTTLRTRRDTIDPTASVVPGNAAISTSLRANIAQTESQIGYLTQQTKNPDAPQVIALRAQVLAMQKQLAAVGSEVSRSSTNAALAEIAGEFEKANNRLQIQQQMLLATQANLLLSQSGLDTSRLYLTTYVKPAVAVSSTFPNRWLSIGLLMLICGMVWLIGLLIFNSVLEHAA